MAAEHQYFYEDEVFRINKKGIVEFGMVLENSELVSSDENSETEELVRMKKGHIRVAWHPSGFDEVISDKKVSLADRSLMPGDVVRRLIPGKDTQRGYCRNINVSAVVQVVGTKQVIVSVNSKDLLPVEEFAPDIAVCMDSWVGTIKSVCLKLHVAFADGSKAIINDSVACLFQEVDLRRGSCCEFPHRNDYHPGQVLLGPMSALEEDGVQWVVCTREMYSMRMKLQKKVKIVVEQIVTESVSVHWQCRAFSKDEGTQEQPSLIVRGDNLKKLKLLNVFEPCTLQVGDRVYYTIKESDVQMTRELWKKACQEDTRIKSSLVSKAPDPPPSLSPPKSPLPSSKQDTNYDSWEADEDDSASVSSECSSTSSTGCASKKKKSPALMTKVLKFKKLRRTKRKLPSFQQFKPNNKVVVETLMTSSSADVVWQDGSVELNIPSYQLYPIHHLDDQEFFPGDFVMHNMDDGCLRVYGVVQSVDHAGRIAIVNWFHTYSSSKEPKPNQLEQNEVSVYDLKDHPDFQYRPGTVAIRVSNFEGDDANCTAGQVLDNYPEGRVHVWWVDGHVSMSWPQDLYKVGDYDSDEGELWDDASSENSWETESEGSIAADEEPIVDELIKPKLAANIEKARVAMSRLEELFIQNPSLETIEVMRKLLEVYKDCRYLDRLMGTSFFNEVHFQGLLERIKEKGRASMGQYKITTRYLQYDPEEVVTIKVPKEGERSIPSNIPLSVQLEYQNRASKKPDKSLVRNITKQNSVDINCVNKSIDSLNMIVELKMSSDTPAPPKYIVEYDSVKPSEEDTKSSTERINSEDDYSNSTEKSPGSLSTNGQLIQSSSADDSGVSEPSGMTLEFSDNCDCNYQSNVINNRTAETPAPPEIIIKPLPDPKKKIGYPFGSVSARSQHVQPVPDKRVSIKLKHVGQPPIPVYSVEREHYGSNSTDSVPSPYCAKLCSLIKTQLLKAHGEISRRFMGDRSRLSFSEVDIAEDDLEEVTEDVNKESNKMETEPSKTELKMEFVKAQRDEAAETTPDPLLTNPICSEGFTILSAAPSSHKYKLTMCEVSDLTSYFKIIKKELTLLRNSLPPGIFVKGFEDRMDLYSVMIRGPEKTPYEDGLFLFDFQLPPNYPRVPPQCHYISYVSDRLNPNLYEDGKVCVSLLGTWSGKGTEVWTSNSTLLQVIVSIQGLILVSEPYFNEAGYEKQKGSQQGHENSRMYNEMAVLKLVQAMTKLVQNPSDVFKQEIIEHFDAHSSRFVSRLERWLTVSEQCHKYGRPKPSQPASIDSSSATTLNVPDDNQPGPSLAVQEPMEITPTGGSAENKSKSPSNKPLSTEASTGNMTTDVAISTQQDAGVSVAINDHVNENTTKEKTNESLEKPSHEQQNINADSDEMTEDMKVFHRSMEKSVENPDYPEFPLLPASRGFCLTLRKTLNAFRIILESQSKTS